MLGTGLTVLDSSPQTVLFLILENGILQTTVTTVHVDGQIIACIAGRAHANGGG